MTIWSLFAQFEAEGQLPLAKQYLVAI